MIGARKGGYRCSPGGGSMNKKKSIWGGGEFPLWEYFLCGQSFLSTYAGAMPFFPCVGRGISFSAWGGGNIIGLAPHSNFCGSLLSQKSFQIVEVLIFFEGAIRSTQKTCPPRAPAPI